MDAVDSQPHPETLKGKAEVERGMAKLTGGRGVSADQSERAYPQAARRVTPVAMALVPTTAPTLAMALTPATAPLHVLQWRRAATRWARRAR